MTVMTVRQQSAWPKLVEEAQQYITTSALPSDPTHHGWVMSWAEELRPGRGCDLSALYLDGEHVVQVMLDPYGHGSVSVAETFWLHSSADEECSCDPCRVRAGGD